MSKKNNILITGGSVRIGKEIALAISNSSNNIIIHYHQSFNQASALKKSVEKLGSQCAVIKCDLSKKRSTEGLIKRAGKFFGPINFLINNASVFENDNINNFTVDSWNKHMNVNLYAPLKFSRDLKKLLPTTSKGHIINILDQNVLNPDISYLSYSLSKAALYSATKVLAKSFAPNIRVNAIGPGPTMQGVRQSADHFMRQRAATVLGRGSNPSDITAALGYFLNAPAVSGQLLCVDGGQHLAWQTPDVLGLD